LAVSGNTGTVASRWKILQNNSKQAIEKKFLERKIGGHTAAIFWEKRPKKIRDEKLVFEGCFCF
jgi:hypothetical protein